MRRKVSGAVSLVVATALFLLAETAAAWPHQGDEVGPGLIYRRLVGAVMIPGHVPSLQKIHVLYVDSWNGAVSFVATRPGDRNLTLSAFSERYRVAAAINANFFDTERASCGLMAAEGAAWDDAYHHLPWGRCGDSVGFSSDNQMFFFDTYDSYRGPLPPVPILPEAIETAVSGMPTLVRDGEVVPVAEMLHSDNPPNLRTRNPRTAIGLHEDGRTVVLVVAEGRTTMTRGLTGLGLARLMNQVLGCEHAVALDGGGSSGMFIRGRPNHPQAPPGIISRPTHRGERRLCCHLGITVDRSQAMWRAEIAEQSPPATVVAGAQFDVWVSYRNRGRRSWRAGGRWPVELLVVDEPNLFPSPFYRDDEWLGPMTPATVEAEAAPGEVAMFVVRAVAPQEPGRYRLALRPVAGSVADGIEIEAPTASFTVEVIEPAPAPAAPTPPAVAPDAGAAAPSGPDAGTTAADAGGSSAEPR